MRSGLKPLMTVCLIGYISMASRNSQLHSQAILGLLKMPAVGKSQQILVFLKLDIVFSYSES